MSGLFDLDDEPVLPEVSTPDKDGEGYFPVTSQPKQNVTDIVPTRDLKTATVYSKYGTDDKLIDNIFSVEGNATVGIYFNQLLGLDDAPRQLDLGLDRTLQMYTRIENMHVYSQSSISYSNDNTTGISTLEVECQIYPGIVPQPGDMMVIAIDANKHGLFVVGNVAPLSWRDKTAHSLTLKMFDFAKDKYLNNLDIKTQKSYVYSVEGASCGNPLVSVEDVQNKEEIEQYIHELVSMYYDMFYDKDTLTLLYPDKERGKVYDHATVEFFSRVIPNKYLGRNQKAVNYSVSSKENRDDIETLWDVLMTGQRFWKHRVCPTYQFRYRNEYASAYTYNHVGTSHVDYVLTPSDKDSLATRDNESNENDQYYVFSKAFYESDMENMTKIETHVHSALDGNPIDLSKLVELIKSVFENRMEPKVVFHTIPVLLYLLLKGIRD